MREDKIEKMIEKYFNKVDSAESSIYDLGTPVIESIEGRNEIVQNGSKCLPFIVRHLDSKSPKVSAYSIDLILNITTDSEVNEVIISLREKFELKKNKTRWDYAAIGQCNRFLSLKQ
jgi:hypothetical protein